MLTNLNWLSAGRVFPPPEEADRLNRYHTNEQLFLSDHPDTWKDAFRALADSRRIRDGQVDALLGYPSFLSTRTADLVCGEGPKIQSQADTAAFVQMLEEEQVFASLYEAFLDVSRYGNGVLVLHEKRAEAVSPQRWFPILDPDDGKTVKAQVLAWPTGLDESGRYTAISVEIHTKGQVETRKYGFDGETGTIGELDGVPLTTETGFSLPAVQVLTNRTHTGDYFGVDDYTAVNALMQKLLWRLACVDRVLDRHSSPSLTGPSDCLEYDEESREYVYRSGSYFSRDEGATPEIQYLTWDGKLEESFEEIRLLLEQLAILTELGPAAFTARKTSGGDIPLQDKVTRLRQRNHATVKNILCMLAEKNGVSLAFGDFSLCWPGEALEDGAGLV